MSVFRMPEGVELDLKIYLIGLIENVETEIVVTARGLPSFSDNVREMLDVASIVKSYRLDTLGTDWRVMTRSEISDYKIREEA